MRKNTKNVDIFLYNNRKEDEFKITQGGDVVKKRNKSDIFISSWITLCVIVILGFFVFSMIIGGSAGLGYQENGRFFVRYHADVVEVTEFIWTISRIWGILFWIFILLTPIGAFAISHIQEKIERRKNRFE